LFAALVLPLDHIIGTLLNGGLPEHQFLDFGGHVVLGWVVSGRGLDGAVVVAVASEALLRDTVQSAAFLARVVVHALAMH